ncbi:TCR/Tet family MFS transporter [Pseudovibrio exalbescens]|uniref:TCR/Tet family MFS transporter n=1 Tax=Pseudovibrio exalbescens TaxID=197461 RepID=UPI00236711B3|nr:TCR/Tet family MFS transporter [Pseudovibrio exalbescens]MDD7912032.1 TCR/Tet family MFS transporter [Pseudovibrio exalbescens]
MRALFLNFSISAKSHTLFFVGCTALLNAIGAGLIIPVTPHLVSELTGTGIAGAAMWGGFIAAVYAIMQFLFGATIGALSDRFGRRPVLLVSLAILVIDYLIMTFANHIWLLFIGRLIAGIASATYATSYAAVADISGRSKRSTRFGMIGACIGMGFVLGPAIGGLLGELGTRVPFYAAAVLLAATFMYGLFYMPETLRPEKRRPIELRKANPVGATLYFIQFENLRRFFIALFLFQLANFVYAAVWPYYTFEALRWTSTQVGLSLAVVGLGFSGVKGGLIRWIIPRHGEEKTALFGFGFSILALFGFAFAPYTWAVVMLLPLAALGAMILPALTGLMSQSVTADRQGELQGAMTSITGLTSVISTLLMTQVFTLATGSPETLYFPGAPFFLAALFMAAAIWPFLRAINAQRPTLEVSRRLMAYAVRRSA